MTVELASPFSSTFNPFRLLGPIFDKELRVCSRRRRNYVLRCAYIAVLGVFILYAWYVIARGRSSGSAVYQTSRSSQIGRTVIAWIVWFQFIVAQLIAIVMLSSSVSDEIRTGTLAVLMTTPIRTSQIVTGKLLSRLLQLILLLAISLPLLAIVRVFGGVTWPYVLSSVCITLTAVVLVGALTLLLSLNYRHAHTVIVVTILFYLVIFGALPALFDVLAACKLFIFSQDVTRSILALTNPFWAFAAVNAKFLFQSGVPGYFSWPLHCLITLVLAAFVLALSIRRVRKVALGEAFERTARQPFEFSLTRRICALTGRARDQSVRQVTGPPIVWKEMRTAILGRGKEKNAMLVLFVGAFVLSVIIILSTRILRQANVASGLLVAGFYLMTMIRLAVFSAGSVTREKEARTWPVLLTTPLDDNEIVRGKAIVAFRRNVLLIVLYLALSWLSLALSWLTILSYGSALHRIPIAQLSFSVIANVCSIAGSVLFVIGSGLYFGVRLRTTTAAVGATAGLYFVVAYLFCGIFNPVRFLFYRTIAQRGMPWVIYVVPVIVALIKGGIGAAFARRAVGRLRRDIF
ncbi:MAG: ABC transporter permease subunit [Sedimentisphaerales bacterium]